MQRFVSWASPFLVAAVLAAQQGSPDSKPPTASSPAERLAALQAEQKQAMADWQKQMREAQQKPKEAQPGKPVAAVSMRPDFAPIVAKAKAAAAEYAGSADAAPFLVFVAQNTGDKDERIAALDTVTQKHADEAVVAELAPMLPMLSRIASPEQAAQFTERLLASKHADVRGWALFAKHQKAIESSPLDGDGYKTAKSDLVAAAAAASDARLKGEIEGAISTREKFGIGCVAPDIEGQDLDGVAFKLSDYKGKVIFLDFWGDW